MSRSAALILILLVCCFVSVYPAFKYGMHFPRGTAAVDYAYDVHWQHLYPANYKWNYYDFCKTPTHPYDMNALVTAADGTTHFTARDANCHLLLDFSKIYELATTDGKYSFIEHAGIGVNGTQRGRPFSIHWYDDNWLANYMSIAYSRPQPYGLVDYGDFTRWRAIGGDTTAWKPYSEDFTDTLALDSLFYIASNDPQSAMVSFIKIITNGQHTYDPDNQRYVYANINENYHYGLVLISAWILLENGNYAPDVANILLQHAISVRSNILSFQEVKDGKYIGWVTGTRDPGTLINIESIAACVLGLGANAYHTFEVGQAPLSYDTSSSYFYRPHNVLSAVTGLSKAGFMSHGPYLKYAPQTWTVKFYVRTPSNSKLPAMTFDVVSNGDVIAEMDVSGDQLNSNNEWSVFSLSFTLAEEAELEFRSYWHGNMNVDMSIIRVI